MVILMTKMVYSSNESDSIENNQRNGDESKSLTQVHASDIEPELSDIFLDKTNSNKNERQITIKESQPLARRSVLYLGTAIPRLDRHGIDSIQEPLTKRYPEDGENNICGIEAWLSIDENGLQIQFVNDPSVILYYPIRSLVYCASIRYIKQTQTSDQSSSGPRFVSLDAPEASHIDNIQNPSLFAAIFQRTRHLPTDECHCFVTKTKHAALDLVEACIKAYETTDPEQDCSKVPFYFQIGKDGSTIRETDKQIYIAPAIAREPILNYQVSTEGSGFFYKTDKVSIDCWQLWERRKHGSNRTSSDHSSSSRSSRPSNHERRQTPVSNDQQTSRGSQYLSKDQSTKPSTPLTTDPYASTANVRRVERIKDNSSGRNVYVRWADTLPSVPEQSPSTQLPNYDFHVDFVTDYPSEKELSKEMNRLELNNEHSNKSVTFNDQPVAITMHHEQNKSQKKHRKHKHRDHEVIDENFTDRSDRNHSSSRHKHHRHKYDQLFNVPPSLFTEQQFGTPTFIQKELPLSVFDQRRFSTPTYFTQPQFSKPTFPPQQIPTPSFLQKELSVPSFNTKLPLQVGAYTFHTIQSNHINTQTPYWYFTM